MPTTLYVVHGSHPCAAVERAFALKGIRYRRVELPPPVHAAVQRVRFGARTVPALRLEDGRKVVGSRAIMRVADELAPDPPLLPADPGARAAVEAAEAWGDEVWQPVARRLLWPSFRRSPRAMASYQEGSSLPPFPLPVLLAIAPVVTRVECGLNAASDDAVRADLRALAGHLDRIDAWLADGTLGTDPEASNAADLQIGATSRLLLTIGDVLPAFDGRAARAHAYAHFPDFSGSVPPGVLPAPWLAEARAAAAAPGAGAAGAAGAAS
jgi:glutathione S-transferase